MNLIARKQKEAQECLNDGLSFDWSKDFKLRKFSEKAELIVKTYEDLVADAIEKSKQVNTCFEIISASRG